MELFNVPCARDSANFKVLLSDTLISRAHGVVVSHPLRMRKALGSNPSVSIFPYRIEHSHCSCQKHFQKHQVRDSNSRFCPPQGGASFIRPREQLLFFSSRSLVHWSRAALSLLPLPCLPGCVRPLTPERAPGHRRRC